MSRFLILVAICFASCSVCPPATEKNVNKWMNKTKFRSAKIESDSCKQIRYSRMLAMSRKF